MRTAGRAMTGLTLKAVLLDGVLTVFSRTGIAVCSRGACACRGRWIVAYAPIPPINIAAA